MTPHQKKFSGILGEFDFYTIPILLAGSKYLIEEVYEGKDPVEWYTKSLEEQEMKILKTKKQTIKGKTFIWIEVEWNQEQIESFSNSDDANELVWKPFYYSCKTGTKEECLGLMVSIKEKVMNQDKKNPIHLATLLDAIL